MIVFKKKDISNKIQIMERWFVDVNKSVKEKSLIVSVANVAQKALWESRKEFDQVWENAKVDSVNQ